jgi:two-component system sporulation sensor kinase B
MSYLYIVKPLTFQKDIALFFALYSLVHLVTIIIAVSLLEYIEENAALRAQLIQTEKLNVMSELAASVAHEIRNPMTVVRGFVQLLAAPQSEEKRQLHINLIISELDRALNIISDFLTLAKPEAQKTERLNVTDQLKHVKDLLASYAAMNNVQMVSETAAHDLYIVANRNQFSQCFINLMKNGIEAMPDGGTLTVRTYLNQKGYVVIEIVDTGIGMDPVELSRLGTPFYSTKEKGTGIGMMVCYRHIEQMNGKIDVQSEKGKGTRFIVQIPAAYV